MSGFDASWLALREPADRNARSAALVAALAQWLDAKLATAPVVRITDLGCGTGSNLRYTAPLLGRAQAWTCVDDDAALLRLAAAQTVADGSIECLKLDLQTQLPAALRGDAHVITASALLDLVSAEWLERLLEAAVRTRAALLFALNYDGRMHFAPAHPQDECVRELFNAHQQRDKSFGSALGPRAGDAVAAGLAQRDYEVTRHASDWQLDAGEAADAQLMLPLLQGIFAAASEQQGEEVDPQLSAWVEDRLALLRAGQLRATIGHQDVLALPQ
jgi:SAM-dependent methyltransferase